MNKCINIHYVQIHKDLVDIYVFINWIVFYLSAFDYHWHHSISIIAQIFRESHSSCQLLLLSNDWNLQKYFTTKLTLSYLVPLHVLHAISNLTAVFKAWKSLFKFLSYKLIALIMIPNTQYKWIHVM